MYLHKDIDKCNKIYSKVVAENDDIFLVLSPNYRN